MKWIGILGILLVTIFGTHCSSNLDDDLNGSTSDQLKIDTLVSALPLTVSVPRDNPITQAKIELGRLLFYDPILSGEKDVACATCHHPNNGYAEFRDISIGVNGKGLGSQRVFKQPNDIPFVKRNSQTILNTAFNGIDPNNKYDPTNAPMFWDIRTKSLELQALEPIKALEEMKGHHFSQKGILEEIITRLNTIPAYQTLFKDAFGDTATINPVNLGKAIATFERTLISNNSRFDQYMRGDKDAISLSEKDGFALFKKVGCINCHNGPMFSDFKIHIIGVPSNDKLTETDKGFGEQFGFRTPSLRNLRFTAPYMHNGSLQDLLSVMEFYEDVSVGKIRNPDIPKRNIDLLIRKLRLKVKDMRPIISFLNSLNDEAFDQKIPETVPSGLKVGGDINM
ncbi:MAG: cytochrome-c peroxidase [Bacteroidetes bacterium]|jgi:cytochrome c peroxidase|nr:cytochrome-c peroxidase [Bacteroidota bacterium]MDF1867696.1 cytochrome c peroxidase [Saprospiraceae bacterium]